MQVDSGPFGDSWSALPRIDEHSVLIAAEPDAVWDALLRMFGGMFEGSVVGTFTRVWGCEPATRSGWEEPGVGTTIPGFAIEVADRPRLMVVAGRHRFSRYAIVFRIEATPDGTVCRAESRAEFPGRHGRAYRLAVIGSGAHVVAVRRMLGRIEQIATRLG